MMRPRSIDAVFWVLLAASFVFALLAASATMWLTSKPYLAESQRIAAVERAKTKAYQLKEVIDPVTELTRYIGSEPSLTAYLLGHTVGNERFIDRLAGVNFSPGMQELGFFDFEGEFMGRHVLQGQTSRADGGPAEVSAQALEAFAKKVIDAEELLFHFIPGGAGLGYVIIGSPIFHKGLVEGVLTSQLDVDVAMQANQRGEAPVEMSLGLPQSDDGPYSADLQRLVVPIGDTGLVVAVQVGETELQNIGQKLLTQTMMAVSVALIIPFALFGWLGRHSILRPHAEVAASRNKLREQQKELTELAAIARKSEEAIIMTDLQRRILWCNPAFEKITGYSQQECLGRNPKQFLQGPETDSAAKRQIRAGLASFEPVTVELVNYRKDKKTYWIRLGISPLVDDAGVPYGFMAISSDITEKRQQEERLQKAHLEIERQAMQDDLTGLANRRYFNKAFQTRCETGQGLITVMRIDLDHFKNVNDTAGHDAGDFVLCRVAQILESVCNTEHLPIRIGGDEFIVLLADNFGIEAATELGETIRAQICEPIVFEGHSISVGASFGIASSEYDFIEPLELVRAADAALYAAKEEGRNLVVVYDAEMHAKVADKRAIAEMIRKGIENNEFEPYYQPQVDAKTRQVTGAEVLMRWVQPERGLITPDEFIQIAAQLSLLDELDHVIMQKAMIDVAALEKEGLFLPKLSINVTANRLLGLDLLNSTLSQNLKNTKISFEILESVFLDDQPEYLDFTLDLYRDKGISIEIDDFGSGHASMISLMRVNPDILKIDQRLVFGARDSQIYRNMVRSIVDIADSLGIDVIAEGVETEEHANLMQDMGCESLQGFFFSKPMNFNDFKAYLTDEQGAMQA